MKKIISIHSFRGGTGKSNITSNVATQIASTGKTIGIVDTDIQSPGINIIFKLKDEEMDKTLNDYLWGNAKIADCAYDVTKNAGLASGKVYLIPSSIKTSEITKVLKEGYDVSLLTEGFSRLMDDLNLDYLFIDTHPGLNEETLLSIALSNTLLLIMRPDSQDFIGTKVTLEVARKLGVPEIFIVVNKATDEATMDELKVRVEKMYNCPVSAVLALSKKVASNASSSVFSVNHPKHQFSRGIRITAKKVVN